MSRKKRKQPVVYSCPKCGSEQITIISAYQQQTRYKCACQHVTTEPAKTLLNKSPHGRYAVRNSILRKMGFASYQAYLDSDSWKAIRTRIMARDHGQCVCCPKPAVSVHHITYGEAVLRGEDDSQLVSICRGCHKFTEFHKDEKLTGTNDIASRLRKRTNQRSKAGTKRRQVQCKSMRPRCRCCKKQYRRLGRADFCLPCYKRGLVTKFLNTQSQLTNSLPRADLQGASTETSVATKDVSTPGFVIAAYQEPLQPAVMVSAHS